MMKKRQVKTYCYFKMFCFFTCFHMFVLQLGVQHVVPGHQDFSELSTILRKGKVFYTITVGKHLIPSKKLETLQMANTAFKIKT